MDGKTAKMQKQVAKLLRHAEDVVGTPEEAVFMAKAFELIAKYGLDMASIQADKQGLDTSDMPDAIKWSARSRCPRSGTRASVRRDVQSAGRDRLARLPEPDGEEDGPGLCGRSRHLETVSG
ncbi:hypothetical protein SEA_MISOMONSTER_80 [Mycobacterium phage Misomonster]|nr:hypothetical protein SEA_MISOMONSTER_80 [Mycobacterium phage Misomonster]